jgi:ATP-dependent helicase/nuclease subunit A
MMRWLRRLLEAKAEVPRLPLEAGDSVTLTTLHGSKGLEWPVVVLPDLDRRVRARSDPVLCDPELGVSVDLGDDKERPMLHRLNSNRKAIAEEAELRRLLYVALTRAGDHLILTTTDAGTNQLCGLTTLKPIVTANRGSSRTPHLSRGSSRRRRLGRR